MFRGVVSMMVHRHLNSHLNVPAANDTEATHDQNEALTTGARLRNLANN